MRIVFVSDTIEPGNGVAASLVRQANSLRQRGHRVRVVGTDESRRHPGAGWVSLAAPTPEDRFPVAQLKMPVVDSFAAPQHFTFGRPDRAVLRRAMEGADVVHIWVNTPLGRAAKELARELRIPVCVGFHVQPENYTYNVGLGRSTRAADLLYERFRGQLYDGIGHIHCPSQFIANQLVAHGYGGTMHVISNGVTDNFQPPAQHREWDPSSGGHFRVVSVGRLSPEKAQDQLVRAVARSSHRDQIELRFCGQGPRRRRLQALGGLLPVRPRFDYLATDELVQVLQAADLYVHTAAAEIEAMSCLEAVACGLVPVISDSAASAAGQFALDARSRYRAGDVHDLAEHIDWWFEHPGELAEASPRYASSVASRRMDRVGDLFEQMLHQAVADAQL